MKLINKMQNALIHRNRVKWGKRVVTNVSKRKIGGLLVMALFSFVTQEIQAVEIEARTGVSYASTTGLHMGAYVNFPQSELFSIQTGLLVHTVGSPVFKKYRDFKLNLFVPVYASFHLPVSEKAKLRLNAGAYVGTDNEFHAGLTGEVGVEIKRFYVGAHCFQNCADWEDTQLGVSFGYSFSLFRKKN